MYRILGIAVAATLCFPAVGSAYPWDGESCSEGRTSTGECVNPRLAEQARRQANIMAHPGFSTSGGPAALPHEDRLYRYPNSVARPPSY